MRLRIVTGRAPLPQQPADGLDTLYQSPTLIIQGSREVVGLRVGQGTQAFLLGEPVAMRLPTDASYRVINCPEEIAESILQGGPEQWQACLEGRYVVATVDSRGTCLLSADRFGQMDVYRQDVEGKTCFATDLSLLPVAGGSVDYDQMAFAHALCVYGYRPPKQHTLYRGVRRLGVGQWVDIQSGQVTIRDSSFHPIPTRASSERELEEYAECLLDAVRVRGSPNGNVVYLSSGWDSTAILACLVKLFGANKVRAVIGRMQYATRSGVINQFELNRAQAVADYFGVRLDSVDFDYRTQGPELIEQLRPVLQAHQLASLTAANHAKLAQFVAQTTTTDEVVFAGEISDGAHNLGFSQFTTIFHPASLEFREYSDKMASYCFGPTFLRLLQRREILNDPVYGLLRSRCGDAIFDEPASDEVGCRTQLLASFFLRAIRLPLWSLRNQKLLTEAGREAYRAEMESTYLSRVAHELTPETLYAWYLYLYNSFHWQSSPVATITATAQACGLRVALPFWDSRLQAFLSAMPESWGRGLDLNPTKYPLKWALKHRIDYPLHLQVGPHSYLYDVDPSFSHGAEFLYGSAFTPYLKALLRKRDYHQVLDPKLFGLQYVDQIVARYLEGIEVRGAEMNDLLGFCQLSAVGWYGAASRPRPAKTLASLPTGRRPHSSST